MPTAFIHKNSYSVSEEIVPRRTVQQDVFPTTAKNREISIDALGYQSSGTDSQGNVSHLVEQAKVSSTTTSYHPIDLLGTKEKIFKRPKYSVLIPFMKLMRRYRLRPARSTFRVVAIYINLGKCRAAITLDVKKSFNSFNWSSIKDTLAG